MSESAFPILTFDENALTPSLGYAFDPTCLDPYESLVGMLWKFSWFNRLPGHIVVSHVAKLAIDPYEGISATMKEINVMRIAGSLHITKKALRQATRREDSVRSRCPDLQFCHKCIARGYHSVVHQFAHQQRCPIHGSPLETHCRRCGSLSNYHLSAKLIGSPFRCAECGSSFSHGSACIGKRPLLAQPGRTAITRAYFS